MAKHDWWFKFEHLKWLTDEQLNRCSLETQGFWIRCICLMHKSGSASLEGTGPQLCRMLGITGGELKRCFHDLQESGAADVTVRHASVTQKSVSFRIVSRKMRKELNTREQNRLRKRRERRHAAVTSLSPDRVISKSKEIKKEKEGKPPLREIHAGRIEAGLTNRLKIQTLPNRREWDQQVFAWAFANDISPEAVLETYDLMKLGFWKDKTVTPKSLAAQIPNRENLKNEIKQTQPDRLQTAAEKAAEDEAYRRNRVSTRPPVSGVHGTGPDDKSTGKGDRPA